MKKLIAVGMLLLLVFTMSGCNLMTNDYGKMMEAFKGRTATIQTYDDDSHLIDQISGQSISVASDHTFDITDEEGNTTKNSSVIKLTVGGKAVSHVGSSLILYENGLTNVFEEYSKKVNVENMDRSVPFINNLVHSMNNVLAGENKVILIRSQSGKPLATFAGNHVSAFATDVPDSTGFIVDGKYLFVYRCDYTVYDTSLLN